MSWLDSDATAYVYVGDRYSQWTKRGPGRDIFLPVVWENGAPLLRWHAAWALEVATGRFRAALNSP